MNTPPILMEFAEEFETERLKIKSPQWGDGKAVNEAIRESIEELRPWLPWANDVPTLAESEENVRLARLKFLERTDLRLHIFLKDTGEFIGSSGLHRINWETRKFEIGYWVRTSQTGKGFMTEAALGITQFTINSLQANRVEIRCDTQNVRSARVAQKLGFTLEGILRNDRYDSTGKLRNTMIFSKVRGAEF